MKTLKIFISLLTLIVLPALAFAEPSPPVLKDIKVSAIVTFDNTSGMYTYAYEVYNPPINDGQVVIFQIDIARPSDTQELSSENLVMIRGLNVNGEIMARSFEEEVERLGGLLEKPIIPVGAQPPLEHEFPGWTAHITVMGTIMWGGSEKSLILPDQRQNGFRLTSYGPPGIRNTIIEPDYIVDMADVPEEAFIDETPEENRFYEYLKSVYDSIAFHTKTIGPTAPPADFEPIAFIDYIIEMKHEAVSLGWITNKGIINSLDAKLENAKKAIERGSLTSAKNVIEAFINEVEAQGCETYDACPEGRHLTPEAHALLKYNAMYLSDRL